MDERANGGEKVLVYGAAGVQGGAVVRHLLSSGHAVRGLVRDERGAQALREAGAEPAFGDLSDPAGLRRASEGVEAVFLVLPLEYDREKVVGWGRAAIDAAGEAGVGRVVFNTSTRVPPQETGVAGFEAKREVEAYLRESGVPHVVLRPAFYMENLAAPWAAATIAREGVVAYPVPRRLRASWISADDMAALSAEALFRPGLPGATLDVGGPEALDGDGVAGALSRALGREVRYHHIPPDEFERGLRGAVGETAAEGIAAMYRWMAENEDAGLFEADARAVLEKLPVGLAGLEEWAASVAEGGDRSGPKGAPTGEASRARVREEIVRQHRLLEGWLAGTVPPNEEEFGRFAGAHEDGFTMVTADGELLERERLLGGLRDAHGTRPGLEIRIGDVRLLGGEGPLLLAAFEERHEAPGAGASTRLNTAVLREDGSGRGGLRWTHLHETAAHAEPRGG